VRDVLESGRDQSIGVVITAELTATTLAQGGLPPPVLTHAQTAGSEISPSESGLTARKMWNNQPDNGFNSSHSP
jgi:hypothetical protein